jgi:hypothetical protein
MIDALSSKHSMKIQYNGYKIARAHLSPEHTETNTAKFAGFRDIPDAHITCKALEGQKNHGTNSNEPRQLQSDASFS